MRKAPGKEAENWNKRSEIEIKVQKHSRGIWETEYQQTEY